MTLKELINECRIIIGDIGVSGVDTTNERLTALINEGIDEACKRSNLIYDADCTVTLISGINTYLLPDYLTFIEYVGFESSRVVHQSKHEVERKTPDWRSLTGMTGKELIYIIRGRSIIFIPTPDATDNGKEVNLEIFRLPSSTLVNDSDVPAIPLELHKKIIFWVLYSLYLQHDYTDSNKAMFYMNKFTEIFGEDISSEVRLNLLEQRSSLHLRTHAYTTNLSRDQDADNDWN